MALTAWLEQSLGSRDGALLAPHLNVRTVPPGTVLYQQDVGSDRLTLLVEGVLEASREDHGARLVFGEIHPGQWLGEIGFVDGGPSTATVTVRDEATVADLERGQLKELLDKDPKAANVLLSYVARQLGDRLRRGTDQVMAQAGDHEWRMEPVEKRRSVWARMIGGLMGGAK